jgi:hypothetical protein
MSSSQPTSHAATNDPSHAADVPQIPSLTHGKSKVDVTEAIRERLQLYPKAMTHEIVAMLELDGLHVSPEEVEHARSST